MTTRPKAQGCRLCARNAPGLPNCGEFFGSRRALVAAAVLLPLLVIGTTTALGHAISEDNASYVEALDGPAIPAFAYLGAKHMVTGIDHLLFLVGVVFFLYRLKDVLLYVSLFTLGHSVTLLLGVLAEWKVDAYIVDAIIGLSVVYKAFENIGGFQRVFGSTPNTRVAVLVFGLFHGLGLATKVQELALADNGLVTNLVSFNVGVELGQFGALVGVVGLLLWWRKQASFERSAFGVNATLMAAGFVLTEYQLAGWFLNS